MKPPFLNNASGAGGSQYLHDLAAGAWYAEVLSTAVELEIFTLLEPAGKSSGEMAGLLGCSRQGLQRFLQALCALGLLERIGEIYRNTGISADFLVKGREHYQGEVILWRKHLNSSWRSLGDCLRAGGRVAYPSGESADQFNRRVQKYSGAMDAVARVKAREILTLFEGVSLTGEMLDVGAGAGAVTAAFLERYPALRAAVLDLPEVLRYARARLRERGLEKRVAFLPANILEPWPVPAGCFELVVLSNIIHVYSEEETAGILAAAAACLSGAGYLLIHDFFLEHYPGQAAIYDLNMLVNTYNGKVFAGQWVTESLNSLGLSCSGLIPLKTDTALIIASKSKL